MTYIGEHVWIGQDEIVQVQTDPASTFDPNFNHIIIGISSKSTEDDLDHINFFKVIELEDGSRHIFQYAFDIIQITLGPRQRGQPDKATLQDGSYMWTTVEPFEGNDYLVSHQVRICNSRQYFDTVTGSCSLCTDLTTGTIGFHETECRSCGDMWFETQDEPESMQALIARQLCEDPAKVYTD